MATIEEIGNWHKLGGLGYCTLTMLQSMLYTTHQIVSDVLEHFAGIGRRKINGFIITEGIPVT